MTHCDDCGAVLLADGTCSVCGDTRNQSSGDQTTETSSGIHQSISIDGTDVDGTVANHIGDPGDVESPVDQSITVCNGRIEGEVANYHSTDRTGEAAELVERARAELQQRRKELEAATPARDLDQIAQLLALVDDTRAIEHLKELDRDTAGGVTDSSQHDSDTVPVAHTLDVLAEVDRLAAAGANLEELYVAIEKVVRLLAELDTDVEEELQAFVERQRALTEGSLFEEELTPAELSSLETLCDRARGAVARQAGGSR